MAATFTPSDYTELWNAVGAFCVDNNVLPNGVPINEWDTSQITNMVGLFAFKSTFNADISNWDVSNVTNMVSMVDGASAFNQDSIKYWEISSTGSVNFSDMLFGTELNTKGG